MGDIAQGVLVDQCGVGNPVGQGVLFLVGLQHQRVGIEVQSLYDGSFGVAITEIEVQPVGVFTLFLDQIAVGECLREGSQHDVIGQEMGVSHAVDGLDVEGVAPDGVLSEVGFERGDYQVGGESQFLAFLAEEKVVVRIFECVDPVGARFHPFDDETPASVGPCHAQHRFCLEGRVGGVGIETYENALDGFQVLCLDHKTGHFHCVYLLAGRETVGVVAQGISLIVVADGIAEVDGIGSVFAQAVFQFHGDAFAGALDFRRLYLWR